jgi:hypothetical protein
MEMTSPRVGHEIYSLDGYLGYYQIMIPPKDKYKNILIIDWGRFVWIMMPFELNNSLLTY